MTERTSSDSEVPDPNEFDAGGSGGEKGALSRLEFSETLAENGYSDVLVLSRERAEDVFHERRLALLEYLSDHEPDSVRAMAEATGYDKGVVSRDLQRLAALDVVRFEQDNNRSKAPRLEHEHVVVEPVV